MRKTRFSLPGFIVLVIAIGTYTLLNRLSVTTGTGVLVTEERSVSGFTRVEVSGISSVILQQGDIEHVRLESDVNLLTALESRVENGVLYLGTKQGITIDKGTIRYTVQESATATILDFQQPEFSVVLGGSSMLTMSGNTGQLRLRQSGGILSAFAFTAQEVDASLSLEASAQITIQDILNVELSRNARLSYRGDPAVTQNVTGSVTLQKVDQ